MAFSERITRILNKKDLSIQRGEAALLEGLTDVERRIFKATSKHLDKLSKKGGKFEFDEDNIVLINKLDRIIIDEIQKSSYPGAVNKYLQNFDTVTDYNSELHGELNDISKEDLEKLVDPFKKQAVEDTLEGLTGAGVRTEFVEPIRQELFKNVVAGANSQEIEASLRRMIEGDAERLGGLSRYVGQVSRDSLNQYDGQINAKIADEFGLDAFQYVGSLIDDSRAQCVKWVNKEVLLKEDLPREISWANSNGSGMIPGTNENNFAVFRGGYNCRHTAIPFKMTKRERAEYDKKEEDLEEDLEEVIDNQIKELEKKPKKAAPKNNKNAFNDDVLNTAIVDPIVKETEKVFSFANNLIQFANAKKMNVNFRTPKQSTARGTEKFAKELNRIQGKSLTAENIGTISTRSNGNCAIDNTFLNIKMVKGDVCEFRPVDLDTSPAKVEEYIKEYNLKEIKHRGTTYLIDENGDPFLQRTRNADGEKVFRFWSVSNRAKIELEAGKRNNVATTATHESAHAIQFNYDDYRGTILKKKISEHKLSLRDGPTIYGQSNWLEFWAESFTSYVYDNKGLKKRSPKVFAFVESYLDELGVLKTVKIVK